MDLRVPYFNGTVGVAVSGGPDSMALLHAYLDIGQPLVVLNVEHGIRGESSLRDSAFVRAFCKEKNIPFFGKTVDAIHSARKGESVETCARRLRYEFFEEMLENGTVNAVALAHHADDNAETLLMRIFRGTGIHGLVGIADRGPYLRPLLPYTRSEIEQYLSERNVPFVIDETNEQNDYTRNFIRNELLPLIETRYPDVIHTLNRLSANALSADEYLSFICPKPQKHGKEFHINNLFGFPEILQQYAIMQTVKEMGVLQDFENRHVEEVLALSDKPNNTVIDLPFSLRCIRFGDGIILTQEMPGEFCEPFEEGKNYVFCGKTYRFHPGKTILPGKSLDKEKIPADAVVRTRKEGDVFKRVNGKTKLLSDFLNEKKLSVFDKERLLVLAEGNTVFAVLGLETSDLTKITSTTTKILHIITE